MPHVSNNSGSRPEIARNCVDPQYLAAIDVVRIVYRLAEIAHVQACGAFGFVKLAPAEENDIHIDGASATHCAVVRVIAKHSAPSSLLKRCR
jgi:hypothetical protein